MRKLRKLLIVALSGMLLLAIAGAGGALYAVHRYGTDLPEYRQLADYRPPTVTRVYAGDGRLMQEYAQEKRVFVPVEAIPKRLIQAFLAAEDKNFYSHPGVDSLGIVRAAVTNVERVITDQRPVGASTITQQVAKNFLLTNEVTLERKIKEALLAFRIEQAFTKDQILELYLNQIYLGLGSYGVAAAALNYFDKSLDELSTAEAAYLAGLPKAPSWYHPTRQPEAAKGRRDWVIGRMESLGVISAQEAQEARAEPLVMRRRAPTEMAVAEYFTEEVRRALVERARRAISLRGRPVDPDHPVAAPADAGRPCPARWAAGLRSPARLAWSGGAPRADRGLAEQAGRDRSDRRAGPVAAGRGAGGRRGRRDAGLSRQQHGRVALGPAEMGQSRGWQRQSRPGNRASRPGRGAGRRGLGRAVAGRAGRGIEPRGGCGQRGHGGRRGRCRAERCAAPLCAAPAARDRGRGGCDRTRTPAACSR